MENNPSRIIETADAIEWLKQNKNIAGASLVASMPDISEFPSLSLAEWKEWFLEAAKLVLEATPNDGVTIFYQSDIKREGFWVDKGYIVQKAAEAVGSELLWHKLVCRVKPGYATFGRPAYTHLLAFSKGVRLHNLNHSTPDVIPEIGDKTWERGMGLSTCLMIASFIKENTESKIVVHPFCGEGSFVAAANHVGLNAHGIERSPKRASRASELKISADGKSWVK